MLVRCREFLKVPITSRQLPRSGWVPCALGVMLELCYGLLCMFGVLCGRVRGAHRGKELGTVKPISLQTQSL